MRKLKCLQAFQVVAALTVAAPLTDSPTARGAPFRNCDQAEAAGAAPIFAGQPGYSSKLDRDVDGVACEQGS
ncbi:excalibur calcium-binding domain-containing protein [Mycobacterium sp. ITM-2016-00318]|uniref:excalibur calcium-binding domain-containing protein n=1 Tax=Mycobacterium sp. ITM-2016-00318 TaxID=2099693 RepID=UPI000CFA4518|nr:excalibur calcium-binding domain-containing protein [Mycobacterium sp. ITM-2016-00318]WNG95002.1 excalibur calcium-binding domain-containing protein [Mycobacterium sp. ITM-2016-00318]